MQLAGQIENLQRIRRDVQNQDWPNCALPAQGHMIDDMNSAINGFIAFLSQDPDTTVSRHFTQYEAALTLFFEEMVKIRPLIASEGGDMTTRGAVTLFLATRLLPRGQVALALNLQVARLWKVGR